MPRQRLFTCTCIKIYLWIYFFLVETLIIIETVIDEILIQYDAKIWVCLEIISEKSKQVSSIQQITHVDHSRVEFGNMAILAEADDRCRLRVLLSTSGKKPLKPGMIVGEWFFNFRSLTAYAVYEQRLELKMKHKPTDCGPVAGNCIGTLGLTVTPAPAFSSSERGKNILEQFPRPHSSNQSPGIFTTNFPTKKVATKVCERPNHNQNCLLSWIFILLSTSQTNLGSLNSLFARSSVTSRTSRENYVQSCITSGIPSYTCVTYVRHPVITVDM
ncbi:hypothetical protein DFJ58DRAFT_378494 [Suillus subalutaceus]|uniref:uncharacterized protein n=1 Tax=Suillus subalutaceus TaxID=48586 RepID=UPI001B86DCFD|nr:uncharacterized protein DFJ58DRAFT_378494 [Suillus subalutaceus]KAG1825140.1 hypothetical protein DFJ58DRAFT_378494 [Suillus subalutaceus]